MTPRDFIPCSWTDLVGEGRIGIGVDLGTTVKRTSNPSALSVLEQDGQFRRERLVLSWKTDDPDVTLQMVGCVVDDLRAAGVRLRIVKYTGRVLGRAVK